MSTRYDEVELKQLCGKIHEAYDEAMQQASRGRGPMSVALNTTYELVHQALLDQRGRIVAYLDEVANGLVDMGERGLLDGCADNIRLEAEPAPDPEPMPDS